MNLFAQFVDVTFEGNQARAALALGLTKSMVSRLYNGHRNVSAEVAARAEKLSEGRFPKEHFIFGPPADPTAREAA